MLALVALAGSAACGGESPAVDGAHDERSVPTSTVRRAAGPALLLAQAQFEKASTGSGTPGVRPGPARLTIVRFEAVEWRAEVLEDADGNVFHKAMPLAIVGEDPGILTIGAAFAPTPARMKVWRRGPAGWRGTTIWSADFGHRFNRFRDVEIGDVTGDGSAEIIVATHDQGVVAVLRRTGGSRWDASVIDRSPNTFVHEIEIGDVDADGLAEIFATPTEPNRLDRGVQPGEITMYSFDGSGWVESPVAVFGDRHAKELLVADLERHGRPDLFAAVEPPAGSPSPEVAIVRYRREAGAWEAHQLATIPAASCRFLRAGDVDGDGDLDIVASCSRQGLWWLRPQPGDRWFVERIDASSTAVELAIALADLDHNGRPEIFVAAEDQGLLRAYQWESEGFRRHDLLQIPTDVMSFSLEVCLDPGCLGGG